MRRCCLWDQISLVVGRISITRFRLANERFGFDPNNFYSPLFSHLSSSLFPFDVPSVLDIRFCFVWVFVTFIVFYIQASLPPAPVYKPLSDENMVEEEDDDDVTEPEKVTSEKIKEDLPPIEAVSSSSIIEGFI